MRKGGPPQSMKGAGVPPSSTKKEPDIVADRKRLGDLVETATTSPLLHLDDRALTSIKSLVRTSDSNVHAAFDFLMDRLKKNHSQVRYLAVLLVDELFTRSKLFRSLLVPVFETFMVLSVGFREDSPLPPPEDRAVLLRKKSIELVEKWKDMFGQHYKLIRLGYDYLKTSLRVEFPNAREVATLASQERREREERTQKLLKNKFQALKVEYPNLKAEIQCTLNEIGECLHILIPPDSSDAGEAIRVDDEEDEDEDEDFEAYGVESLRGVRDTIAEQDTVPHESLDNSAVFDTLRDLYRLLTRHIMSSQEWLTMLVRLDPEDDRQSRDTILRETIDLRNHLLATRAKCEGLGIQRIEGNSTDVGDDLDDVTWEQGDVLTNEGSEAIPQTVSAEITNSVAGDSQAGIEGEVEKGKREREVVKGKPEREAENGKPEREERIGVKQDLLKQAPVLPWGTFLDTWGSQSAVPANPRGLEFENHWGRVDYDVMIPAEKIAEISVRASYYKAPKVEIRPCLAPLRKGGLCQRRDLRRCPLHGPVIPRDEKGNPIPEEIDHTQSPAKCQAEDVASEETVGSHSGEGDNEAGIIPGSSSADPVQLAEQAIRNVRKKEQAKVLARKQRAKITREHNSACLKDAALASVRLGFDGAPGGALDEGAMNNFPTKKPRGGLTALLRKKPTSKDRLARRLLNGRVRDATVSQLTRDQEAAYRESFPNQWN